MEHVWVVVGGTRLYYHLDRDVIDSHPLDTVVTHVGAGCIAWDGSDWEFSCEEKFESTRDIDIVRQACVDAYEEYHNKKSGEAFLECENDDECPICENGTVEVTAASITCRGECGTTLPVEYVYLNPSTGGGSPDCFVYHGVTGDPFTDHPQVFVNVGAPRPAGD